MAEISETLRDPTNVLPFEVSVVIFSFIPAEDLVKNCVLVSQFWKRIGDDQTTWRLKCEHTGRYCHEALKAFEPDNWKQFYYKNPFRKNLIQNGDFADSYSDVRVKSPSDATGGGQSTAVGDDNTGKTHILASWHGYGDLSSDQWNAQFVPWSVIEIGGDGLQLECPPIGCCDLPSEAGPVCIATSFGPAIRCQVIDLVAEGIPEYVLDECNLPIHVHEWFNARFDCGCQYYMKVSLRDKKRNKFDEKFKCKVKLEGQKRAGQHEWEKLEHTFRDYPPGVRYIYFLDYGQDTQFWRGFYGAKLAGATAKFRFK